MRSPGSKLKNAFSLVEVSLSLAIVGISFVALLGILPMGLQTFKSANETTVDARMMTVMSSILQATEYSKVVGATGLSQDVFYFDVDGEYLDSKLNESPRPDVQAQRQYAARILVEIQEVPATQALAYDRDRVASRVIMVSGRMLPAVIRGIEDFTPDPDMWSDTIKNFVKKGTLKVRPTVLASLEGSQNSASTTP